MKGIEGMELSNRRWVRLLISLLPVGWVLVACSNVGIVSDSEYEATTEGQTVSEMDLDEGVTKPASQPGEQMTINVSLTDDGFEPSSIFIPVGRRVKLIVRNRGTGEHHYRVVGLMARDLLWLTRPEGVREEGVTDQEHELHHSGAFTAYRGASRAGIKPFGDEVHAYVDGGGIDMVLFVPTNTGTFRVECPLHPEAVGKVTVF